MNNYTIEQLVNIQQVEQLLEAHTRISGIACGLTDNDGNILIGAGLQQVCTRFLCEHQDSFARCWRSDPEIRQTLDSFNGDLFECHCKNGMISIAMPIIIEDNRLAIFFSGQFFYDDQPPELAWFQQQAEELGFDIETYLAVVRQVPLFSHAHVDNTMRFLHQLVQILAETGHTNLQRQRELEERKQTEQQINLLNFALDQVGEAVFLKDIEDGRFLYVNQEACRSLEYDRDELTSMSALDINPTLSAESLKKLGAELLKKGSNIFETTHQTKSGTLLPVEISATIFAYDGTHYSFALVRDITERRQTEQQIKLLNHALDHVHEGAFLRDQQGRFLYVNQQACRSLGYSREALLGMDFQNIDPDLSPEFHAQHLAELERHNSLTFERRHRTQSGHLLPVEITSSLFSYGDTRYVLSLVRDITERKRMEEALRESEEHFRLLVELSPDLIFIRYGEQIVYANPAAVRIVGAGSALELIGRSVLDFARPERREYLKILMAANDTTPLGTVIPPYEGTLVRLDGSTIPIEITAVRFQYRGMECSQQIMRDITERTRAEQVTQARLRLLQTTNQPQISLHDSLRLMLDEIETLTGSAIAFYHFLDEDRQTLSLQAWSTATVADFCRAEGMGSHYPVERAGVWADAVRERKPVIHNNYAALPNRKGMPEGHAAVIRELVVPIIRRERIVAVIGVGNKPTDYTEADLQAVALLGDLSWEIVTRKQAEERIKLREREFRTLAENSPDSIIRYDLEHLIIYLNNGLVRELGLANADEVIGKRPIDIWPDGRFAVIDEAAQRAIATGEAQTTELVWKNHTGQVVFGQIFVVPERDVKGRIVGTLAFGRNVTALKTASERMELLEHAINHGADDVYLVDGAGRIRYCNAAACRALGYAPDELLQLSFSDIDPDYTRERLETLVDEVPEEASDCFESRHRRRNGELFPVEIVASPVNFGGERLSLAVARDISERKQAEEKLRESEERLRLTLEATQIGIFDWDVQNDRWTASPVYYTMLGYKPENGQLNRLQWLERLHPDDREYVAAKIHDVLAGSPGDYQYEARMLHADGTFRWQFVKGFGIERDPAGKVSRMLGVRLDITNRKRAEESLRRLNEELEERITARTAELEQANTRLMELDRMKSMFIASMSHELRTPLNSAIGYSRILLNEWVGPLNDEQKDNLAAILRSGMHLLSLVNDVIDVSKIEAGLIEAVSEAFDIYDLVTEVVRSFGNEVSQTGVALRFQAVHHRLQTDRTRLLQCLLNLVSNAVKYTEQGSITICAMLRDDDLLEISVTDTGIGIREEELGKLFAPFARLDSALKATVPGTGLGLYLTRKLMQEILHGDITVTSAVNVGSRFVLTLPTTL